MVSLFAVPAHFRLSRPILLPLNSSAVSAASLPTRQALPVPRLVLKQGNQFLGVVRKCKRGESEDFSALEEEVLGFMLQSEDQDRFPSRKELIEGGRRDLADAIVKRGGWMSRGWDLVSDDDESDKAELDALLTKWNSTSARFDQENSRLEANFSKLGKVKGFASYQDSSDAPASSSGRSVETEPDEDGVNGILNRLKKQRNLSMDLYMEKRDNSLYSNKNQLDTGVSEADDSCYPPNDAEARISRENNTAAIQEKKLSDPRRGNNLNTIPNLNGLRNSLKPDTWSIQRAGSPGSDFEAADINFDHSGKVIASDSPTDQIIALHKGDKEEHAEMIGNLKSGDKYKGNRIRSRLHNLELELSSSLHLLRSNPGDVPQKVVDRECLSEEYMNLSDELEFQENEIMNARAKLRSLRARLAVLEGKVALTKVTKIDEQKGLNEKQNRINDARKALQLLRTTCVVFPNTASEVLVAGTFDGWATQRKMEKSSKGIFSLWLRLYPGRYEFKFIVDGMWKIDPLRPIVNNNGNKNNLLIIT